MRSLPPCGLRTYPTSFDRSSNARSRCCHCFIRYCDVTVLAEPGNEKTLVRELRLRRRRSRVPWVYVVYQLRSGRARTGKRESADPSVLSHQRTVTSAHGGSALPTQKRGHVERRIEIEAVLVW